MTAPENDIPAVYTTADAIRAYKADRAANAITAQCYHAARMIDACTLTPPEKSATLDLTIPIWQFSAAIGQYCDVCQEEQTRNPYTAKSAADHAERHLDALRKTADQLLARLQSRVDDLTNGIIGSHASAYAGQEISAHVLTLLSATAKAHTDAGSAALKARHATLTVVINHRRGAPDLSATEEARTYHETAAQEYQKVATLHRRTRAALNYLIPAEPTQEGSPDDSPSN